MIVDLDLNSICDYKLFLRIKSLPRFRFSGRRAIIADEYANLLGMKAEVKEEVSYRPNSLMFDYQRDIAKIAVRKKKFALFIECGYGKSLIMLDYARHVSNIVGITRNVLIVSPLMVIKQTMAEAKKFYPEGYAIEQISAKDLGSWLMKGSGIGITNYDGIRDELEPGRLACLILDESSCLKGHYGKWGTKLIDLGKGLEWKLCGTGTPAPNDRVEYANHAVFLDSFPSVNSFLASFFVNRGKTGERWELKPHSLHAFYRALADFSIFMSNPGTYGWKSNSENIPPIQVQIHDVDLTKEQNEIAAKENGTLFAATTGGIGQRSFMGQLAKGHFRGKKVETNKPQFIRDLVDSWIDKESTIIWCLFNKEQEELEKLFPDAHSLKGDTPYEDRERMIDDFKAERVKTIISKSAVMGFGLNLQIATRMIFSGLADSFEMFHQCVKRANRVGSVRPLNVHIPLTELERPMVESVLRKEKLVDLDSREQETIFKKAGGKFLIGHLDRSSTERYNNYCG